ncbi:FlgO family outer membrane protein [uncultured Shewanella sp.]|uniref:FlgO family outer membrane protein n=1 Tax=uncultured Shewanella sp. TaxID=173975 RepID=UPI002611348A|nr:FlgO family outer membrane protein [uncultured Shewanella sp.]
MLKIDKANSRAWQRQLKRFLGLSLYGVLFTFIGCSSHEGNTFADHTATDITHIPLTQNRSFDKQSFHAFASQIANLLDELVVFNQGLPEAQLIVVATPVLLSELTKTNAVGLALQDSLMTGLQQRAFTVIDANMSPKLKVTSAGDFMLTRDWRQLSSSLMVDHALVSTMILTPEGLILNARLLHISSQRVMSSAQTFFSHDELAGVMTLEQTRSQQALAQQTAPKVELKTIRPSQEDIQQGHQKTNLSQVLENESVEEVDNGIAFF